MPRYAVTALEKFLVKTTYHLEAADPRQAEAICKAGRVAYEDFSVEEGDDEWVETVAIEELACEP
jgi:hypothetical protein